MNHRFVNLAIAPLILLLGIAGCEQPAPPQQDTAPPVVTVAKPVQRNVRDHEDFPNARTEAVDSVEIRSQVSGYIDQVAFKPGAEVKKDDLLYVIDPRPYKAEFDQAKASVARSEAAQRQTQAEYERSKRLQGMGGQAISQEELDRAAALRDGAIAGVASSKASLEKADLNLKFTRILAPVAGRVSKTRLTEGNLVTANGEPLTTVVSQDPIYATFDVDDRTLLRLQRLTREGKVEAARDPNTKLEVLLGLQNEVGYPHAGIIDFIDNQVNHGTGSLKVRAIFKNSDGILTPGLAARVQVPIGKPHQALLVSERAIGVDQGQKYLLVVAKDKDGKDIVGYRAVRTGELQDDGLRVIEEGLKPDDQVIVIGMQRVRPDVRIDPKEGPMPTRDTQGKAKAAAQPSAPTPSAPAKPSPAPTK